MENETEVSLWSKKQDELTVGDSVKIAVAVTVITTAASFVIIAAVGGIARLAERRQMHKTAKLEVVNEG